MYIYIYVYNKYFLTHRNFVIIIKSDIYFIAGLFYIIKLSFKSVHRHIYSHTSIKLKYDNFLNLVIYTSSLYNIFQHTYDTFKYSSLINQNIYRGIHTQLYICDTKVNIKYTCFQYIAVSYDFATLTK